MKVRLNDWESWIKSKFHISWCKHVIHLKASQPSFTLFFIRRPFIILLLSIHGLPFAGAPLWPPLSVADYATRIGIHSLGIINWARFEILVPFSTRFGSPRTARWTLPWTLCRPLKAIENHWFKLKTHQKAVSLCNFSIGLMDETSSAIVLLFLSHFWEECLGDEKRVDSLTMALVNCQQLIA